MSRSKNQAKEQSPHDANRSRAAASSVSSNSFSLQPPAQFTLQPGRSYYSLAPEDFYKTKSGKLTFGKTQPGTLYSALEHDAKRTLLKQHSDELEGWVETRSDLDDLTYYKIHDPKLAVVTAKGYEQDDPQSLINGGISMMNFPNYTTMPSSPTREDAQQGELGNCTVISSMASTVNSDHYRSVLKSNYDDTDNIKKVSLYHPYKPQKRSDISDMKSFRPKKSTKKTEYEVRPSFPYIPASNSKKKKDQLLYAQPDPQVLENIKNKKPQPLWPSVLESAMAQSLGEYGNLDNKEAEDMMSMLTGTEPVVYANADIITYWDEIKDILNNDGAIVATSIAKVPKTKWGKKLIDDHAYSVAAMNDTEITLYNPYGEMLAPMPKAEVGKLFAKFSVTMKD